PLERIARIVVVVVTPPILLIRAQRRRAGKRGTRRNRGETSDLRQELSPAAHRVLAGRHRHPPCKRAQGAIAEGSAPKEPNAERRRPFYSCAPPRSRRRTVPEKARDRPGGFRDDGSVCREIMRAARKQHELAAGNDRREQPSLVGADGH